MRASGPHITTECVYEPQQAKSTERGTVFKAAVTAHAVDRGHLVFNCRAIRGKSLFVDSCGVFIDDDGDGNDDDYDDDDDDNDNGDDPDPDDLLFGDHADQIQFTDLDQEIQTG